MKPLKHLVVLCAFLLPQPNLFAGYTGFKDCQNLLTNWSDGFEIAEEQADFWNYHPRFGLVKQNDRILLVAKSAAVANQVVRDIEAWNTSLGLRTTGWVLKGFARTIKAEAVLDITEILPPLARDYHLRLSTMTNCWGFACHAVGASSGIFAMNDSEFGFLLSSPLARKLAAAENPRPGDLIAFRVPGENGKTTEVHGALYISDDLVMSKNGEAETPFRLQDSHEVIYQYQTWMTKYYKRQVAIEFYRVQPLGLYIAKNRESLSEELLVSLKELKHAEDFATFAKVDPTFDLDKLSEAENNAYQEQWRNAHKQVGRLSRGLVRRARAALEKLGDNSGKDHDPNLFLWKLVLERATSLFPGGVIPEGR